MCWACSALRAVIGDGRMGAYAVIDLDDDPEVLVVLGPPLPGADQMAIVSSFGASLARFFTDTDRPCAKKLGFAEFAPGEDSLTFLTVPRPTALLAIPRL